jgi:hypothetical protein
VIGSGNKEMEEREGKGGRREWYQLAVLLGTTNALKRVNGG